MTEDEEGPEVLGVDVNQPCFLMERVSLDDAGPVDFSRSLVRGDRYQIHLGLRTAEPALLTTSPFSPLERSV